MSGQGTRGCCESATGRHDDGYYSGTTTTNLTVSPVNANDVGAYRAVVTDSLGTTNSSNATLSLKTATGFTQYPAAQTVCAGSTVSFSVVATGDGPITCQWQTNGVNISNNSHYSGCTTATLTVSNVTSADAVNYTCVAAAGCGSVTSAQATLTLSSPTLLNGSFEAGNVGGVGVGWTGYQRPPNPTTAWSIQTAGPPPGGGLQYQQIANTASGGGGGGVRQDITGCTVGATYRISGWMRGNSELYSTCTVKVSPTASTNWATAVNLNPPATFTGNYWTSFSGTVVATATSMTLWLDGQSSGTGNKAECFDAITVTCAP